jgi:hypothetical protein
LSEFITVAGTLTKVDWFNPHIAVIVDVAGTSGVETWKFQSNPPAWWKGVGVNRADFAKLGQPVTIGAYSLARRFTRCLHAEDYVCQWRLAGIDPAAWTLPPRSISRSTRPLEESPTCREQDGPLLRNNDHHDQR